MLKLYYSFEENVSMAHIRCTYFGSGTNGSNMELEKLRVCFFILFWEPFLRSSFQWSLYFLKQHKCFGEVFREAGRVGIAHLREEAAQGESYQYLQVRCTKHGTRLFSVVFCARTRGNWHKLKHRRFCLYTRSALLCFWQSTGKDCLGTLWNLSPCRFLRAVQTRSYVICLSRGSGPVDIQKTLPT